MDTFSNGAPYTRNNIQFEDSAQPAPPIPTEEFPGGFYGRSAQSNQEIADLAVEAVNRFIDSLATAATNTYPVPSGQFRTFGVLESYIPTYFKKVEEAFPIQSDALNEEYSFRIAVPDFAYPCAAEVMVERHLGSGPNPAYPEPRYKYFSCVPITTNALLEIKRSQYDEFDQIPLYRIASAGTSTELDVYVFVQGNISDERPMPPTSKSANFSMYYIAKQMPIDLSSTTPEDILLSSRYDEYILQFMIEAYERLKQ